MRVSYHLTACFLSSVITLTACESEATKAQNAAVARLQVSNRRHLDSIANAPKPAPLAVRPCDRPRPYKNWSNEELNIAQVEYMGTPQSLELIREAGCRTR